MIQYIIIILILSLQFLCGQTLKIVQAPKIVKDESKAYQNTIIDPKSKYGTYQIRKKKSQELFVFKMDDGKLKIKKDFSLQEAQNNRRSIIDLPGDQKQVSLAPFLMSHKHNPSLLYAFINQSGDYQINNYLIKYDELITTDKTYDAANYPYTVPYKKNKFFNLATIDGSIKYSISDQFLKNAKIKKKKSSATVELAPILSPNKKYIAYTRAYVNQNKSSVVIDKIYHIDNIEFKEFKEMDFKYGAHSQSPSWPDDSKKVAFYSNKRTKGEVYDLYVYYLNDNRSELIAEQAFRKTMLNRGPTWLDNHTIIYVKHASQENFPIYYVDIRDKKERPLPVHTIMNKDITSWQENGIYNLLYISKGRLSDRDITWNKIYHAKLRKY